MEAFKVRLVGQDYLVRPLIGKYIDGSTAIRLMGADADTEGEQIAVATVCLPNDTPVPGFVWIKDYSENEGLADQLESLGLIRKTGLSRQTRYVQVHEYELTGELALEVANASGE